MKSKINLSVFLFAIAISALPKSTSAQIIAGGAYYSLVICNDSTVYYLNPVFRYDGIHLPYYVNEEDKVKTFLWRAIGVIGILLIYFGYNRKRKQP